MDTGNIISLLGGIAMFLYGMSVMGDSLKKVAGSRMEMVLYKLAGNTAKGILLGTGVTAVIQSSSATSVMVVGFVNASMMKVRQAIGVILGAILGTSITGWILCLNSLGGSGASMASFLSTENLTGLVALVGIALWMFARKNTARSVGGIMLGFAVLMYGMSTMSGAIAPLREDETFVHALTTFSHPMLGVIAGVVITAVIQSASAAVGILQALAATGAIEFDLAFPIILGIGIGASVPVMLSALGADTNGKRTAFAYLVIDALGAIVCGVIFYTLNAVIGFSFMSATMTIVTIALLNTLYRFAMVILLSPCIGIMEKIVCVLFPDSGEAAAEKADMDRLEPRFLEHPSLALAQSQAVIDTMARLACESIERGVAVRREFNREDLKKVTDIEDVLDRYEDKLGSFLIQITSRELTPEQSVQVSRSLSVLSDFERISDHARNLGEAAEELHEKKIRFSRDGEADMRLLEDAITEIVGMTIRAFIENDMETALRIYPLEEVIDDLCDDIKTRHIDRVSRQECTLENGFVFNDLLTDYERISDHCSNIAVDILDSAGTWLEAHDYEEKIDFRKDSLFSELFQEYARKYSKK